MSHILITGASSGIGAELAAAFTARGHHVSGLARRAARLEDMAGRLSGFTPLVADVADSAATMAAISESAAQHGVIDTAVLNAGIYIPQDGRTIDPEVYRRHMEINYMGVVNGLAAVVPAMVARGQGHIVIVSSVTGWRGLPKAAAYGPTKAALISLAESLAFDLIPAGIKIQLVSPGFVDTESTAINDFEMPGLVSASHAAREIISGMQRDEFEITFPKGFTRMVRLASLMPWRRYFSLIRKRTGS